MGEEALKEAPKGVDLLIADYKLPGISGSELVGRIRTKFPTVKVIMISGMMEDQLTQSARELEVDFRLKKPMEIEEFLAAARTCLHLQERGGEAGNADNQILQSRTKTILDQLQADLNAISCLLVAENGEIISRAGSLPEKNFETRWIPAILNAGMADSKILHLFPTSIGDGLHAYMGSSFHMVIISVFENTLIAALKPEPGYSHLLMSLGVVIEAQRNLIKVMSGKVTESLPSKPVTRTEAKLTSERVEKTTEKETAPKEETDDFAAKLSKATPKLAEADLDKFWEEPEEAESTGGEGLTYKEAQKKRLFEG